jgi:hypothetical protein
VRLFASHYLTGFLGVLLLLPAAGKENFLATYFTGLFRAMRFGTGEAHGRGGAFQYRYFRNIGAVSVDEASGRFLDFEKLEQGIADLTRDVVVLQGNGDIQPVYPDEI